MFEALVMTAAMALPAQESGKPLHVQAKSMKCKSNRRFGIEDRWGFNKRAKLTGRCVTTHFKKIDTVHTRPGHHPSASRAMDMMTNTHGSCTKDRKAGDKAFKYIRKNWKRFGVWYVIWKNKYYNGKHATGRHMSGGGCTHGHYDHLHVAFK